MSEINGYKYLGPRLGGSRYRQLFVKGTRIRAAIVADNVLGPEAMSPEEAAANWNLPVEVVLECVRYTQENADLLREEAQEEEADLARRRAENPEMYPLPPKS
ncbi:MAG TPA: hypothetical protein VKD90_25430 [Gemmataceae bacterium]|nr:hypothetical protein [Gemmataceae bacterium]